MGEEFIHNYLGIDPSTVSTGYAVIDQDGKLILKGVIKPEKSVDGENLAYQYQILETIIKEHSVKTIGCEDQFSGPNVKTLVKIARTASIPMLLASQHDLDFYMFYPASWRLIFHGNGKAKKADTLAEVNNLHNLSLKKAHNDIADAIGIAHAVRAKCLGVCEQTKKKKSR